MPLVHERQADGTVVTYEISTADHYRVILAGRIRYTDETQTTIAYDNDTATDQDVIDEYNNHFLPEQDAIQQAETNLRNDAKTAYIAHRDFVPISPGDITSLPTNPQIVQKIEDEIIRLQDMIVHQFALWKYLNKNLDE